MLRQSINRLGNFPAAQSALGSLFTAAATPLQASCPAIINNSGTLCFASSSTSTSNSSDSKEPASSSNAQQQQGAQAPKSKEPVAFSVAKLMMDTGPSTPLSSAEFASSMDDKFGVQKNWFTALYKQLNYMAKTGAVPSLKGRQREVFEQVEREFEGLYNKHIAGKGLEDATHRSMLMCCLSVATYRVLNEQIGDTKLVRDIIRTNLGGMMLSILRPVHRFKLWILRYLLREDMYKQAVNFLPALSQDMGGLCTTKVDAGENVTTMTVSKCAYHDMLTQEDTPFLLSEFCCHHGLIWMHEFRKHGVHVSLDQCQAWDDSCCQMRVARAGHAGAAAGGAAGSSSSSEAAKAEGKQA